MKKLFNPISKPQPLPTPLMELAQFTQSITTGYSGKSSATTTGPKLLRPMNIQGNKINWDNVNHCDIIDTDKTKYQLRKGDILIISGGPTAGRSLILDQDINDCIYASSLLRIRCNTNTTAEYLAYYFRSKAYWAQLENLLFSGTVQRRVNTSQFKRLPLPVASLDEQKVITTQLNTLLTQAESTKAGLEETTATLKSFRQSVLNAAVNGKLTEQWRQHNRYHPISIDVGIPAMADSWQIVKLEQLLNPNKPICYGAVGSSNKGSDEANGDVKLVRAPDINIESTVGKINWHNLQTITNEVDEQYKKSRVTKGDILVIPTGFVIKIGFVDTDQPVNITRTIVRISPDITKCEPEYIHIYLNSPALQSWLASATSGISHRTLSSKTLKNTNIVLPPLPEQAEIVRQVTSSFDFANQIEQQVATAHVRMNELIQSILFEAFSGKLRSKP